MAITKSFWEAYNSEDSFLPFYIPMATWVSMYFIGKSKGIDFHNWTFMHNVHNLTAIALGTISLYIHDDAIFNERITILFSWSYFLLDFLDCLVRKDWAYTAHAFFCLTLGVGNYVTPVCRELRMNSKACMIELSSPFLHVAKQTRTPWHFLLFALVFTLCRIIWVPMIMKQVHDAGLTFPTDARQILLLGFYGLNCFWYFKMVRIIIRQATSKQTSEDEKKKN